MSVVIFLIAIIVLVFGEAMSSKQQKELDEMHKRIMKETMDKLRERNKK